MGKTNVVTGSILRQYSYRNNRKRLVSGLILVISFGHPSARAHGCAPVFAPRRSRAPVRPSLRFPLAQILLVFLEFAQSVVYFLFDWLSPRDSLRLEIFFGRALLSPQLRARLL